MPLYVVAPAALVLNPNAVNDLYNISFYSLLMHLLFIDIDPDDCLVAQVDVTFPNYVILDWRRVITRRERCQVPFSCCNDSLVQRRLDASYSLRAGFFFGYGEMA